MNKNKFLTVFAATMLSSCAGFASDSEDEGDMGSFSSSSAGLPVTPVKAIMPLQLGDATYSVTPGTYEKVDSMVEKTPALEARVKGGFSGKAMNERQRARAEAAAIAHEKLLRDANMHTAHAIATSKDKELKSRTEKKIAFASAEKHKKSRAKQTEDVTLLTSKLSQTELHLVRVSADLEGLVSEKEQLQSQIEAFEAEKESLSSELESLSHSYAELKEDAGYDKDYLATREAQIDELALLLRQKGLRIIELQNNLSAVELAKERAEIYMSAVRSSAVVSAAVVEEVKSEEGGSDNAQEESAFDNDQEGGSSSDDDDDDGKPGDFSLEDPL